MSPTANANNFNVDITKKFFDRSVLFADLAKYFDRAIKFSRLHQVHGNQVAIVTSENFMHEPDADACVTTSENIALTIHTADCLPLLAYGDGVIGACHGGWRGVSSGVIENWIAKMGELGAKKENIHVSIGPAIGSCHFEVGKDVAEKILAGISLPGQFLETVKKRHPDVKKEYVDLKEVARYKLLRLGISTSSLMISRECTYCKPESYFSYRRDGAQKGARLEAVIVKSQH